MKFRETRLALTEVREEKRDEGSIITGKIPYNTRSLDLGGFYEVILPTAFANTLNRNDEVWSLFNHDHNKAMARRSTGTLILDSQEDGLHIEISPSNTSWGNDALEVIRHGDSDGFSFGFYSVLEDWKEENGDIVRYLVDTVLDEVSVAFRPAYPDQAEIGIRVAPEVRAKVNNFRSQKRLKLAEYRQKFAGLTLL